MDRAGAPKPALDLPTASRLPLLSPEEEHELALRSAAGDAAAAERLVVSHLRLVVGIAQRYGAFGLPMGDLVQEGTLGLIQAVRRFDPERDARLSTYAMWWVRAAMQDYVVRSWSLVRLGKTTAHRTLFFALRRKAGELRTSADALGDEMLGRLAQRFALPVAEVRALARRAAGFDQSLDQPAADDPEGGTLLDRLPADQPDPEDIVAAKGHTRLWNALLEGALAMLPAREAAIIRQRHLSEAAPTFEAIGRELGISKDRVRQLEKRALGRLRDMLHPLALAHGLPHGR